MSLEDAFEVTIRALGFEEPDRFASLTEVGRTLSKRIDVAVETGEGQEVTKALYLAPHLLNVLRELQATPTTAWEAKRRESEALSDGKPSLEAVSGKLASIQARTGRARKGA